MRYVRCQYDSSLGSDVPSRQSAGFTMLEMLIAVTVTILIVGFLSQIFGTVSQVVSQGIASSNILRENRVLSGQIAEDVQSMVGPSQGGFVIVTKEMVSNVRYHAEDTGDPESFHTDTLAFVRFRGNLNPLTPGGANSYGSTSTAPFVRVYYGHGLRINPRVNEGDPVKAHPLGQSGGTNRYAINWTLCRHMTFLEVEEIQGGLPAHSDTAEADSSLKGETRLGNFEGVPKKMHSGLVSIASQTLDEIADDMDSTSKAVEYTFFGQKRLWVASEGFEPWEIALQSSQISGHVSDFEVEWTEVDAGGNLQLEGDGRIRWRSKSTQGQHIYWGSKTNTIWPRMLRLRYRLHDGSGSMVSVTGDGTESILGRYFEQVINLPE